MDFVQPISLYNFIKKLDIQDDGTVSTYSSRRWYLNSSSFYYPEYKVSYASRYLHKTMTDTDVFTWYFDEGNSDSLVNLLTLSGLKIYDSETYILLQSIFLESLTLIYATENENNLSSYFSKSDATRLHQNINFAISKLSEKSMENIGTIIYKLRKLDIDTMYMWSTISSSRSTYTDIKAKRNLFYNSNFKNSALGWKTSSEDYSIDNNSINLTGTENLTVTSPIIYVASMHYVSLSVSGCQDIKIKAVDEQGKTLTKYVDNSGNVVTNGIVDFLPKISDSGVLSNGISIPNDISFIRFYFNLNNSDGNRSVYQPMLVEGNIIGNYIPGVEI